MLILIMKRNPINIDRSKKMIRGFTLVELLVVIAIIAIITAITTMSYTAIQARSKASKAVTLGNQVARKAEGWFSVQGVYPTYTQLSTGKINVADATQTGPYEARIDNPDSLYDATTGAPTDEKRVGYMNCTVGGQVEYYDALAKAVVYIDVDRPAGAACP
jgi:prepilin-type N-terminal cleavage/methylation domain-containing protein